MMHPVIDWHIGYQEGIDAFKAANVVTVLIRKRAALMVGVDAADTACCRRYGPLLDMDLLLLKALPAYQSNLIILSSPRGSLQRWLSY